MHNICNNTLQRKRFQFAIHKSSHVLKMQAIEIEMNGWKLSPSKLMSIVDIVTVDTA